MTPALPDARLRRNSGYECERLDCAYPKYFCSRNARRMLARDSLTRGALRSGADLPTQQLTRDAERNTSRRRPFLRPLPRLFATHRRRSRPLTLPPESRPPPSENYPLSRFRTPSDPANSPTLGGSLPTPANPRPACRGPIQAEPDQTLRFHVPCVDRSLHAFCQVQEDFPGRREARAHIP